MQTIFYNAKLNTFENGGANADAFLVNDGIIVFVGAKNEVFEMKTDETELVDLNGQVVMPAFFDLNASIYDEIENRLRNPEKIKFIENPDEIDENYEKFDNYEVYKNEFLEIQKDYLAKGITTVQELYIDSKEFTFWKKLSEEKLLELDVIAYVDIKTSKQVMDNNCRTYRKYKNHFRLGGYSLAIDGKLADKKAWLNKPYKKEHGYHGFSEYYEEQLSFLFKTVLEEKKQIVIETNGDRALDLFLNCFEETVIKEKVEDKFRPIALNCNIVSLKQLQKMKELEIMPSFDIESLVDDYDKLVKAVGLLREKKIQPLADADAKDMKFLIHSKMGRVVNGFELAKIFADQTNKKLSKHQKLTDEKAMKVIVLNTAFALFDQELKSTIENGKQATFIVVDENKNVLQTYIQGELKK